MKKAHRTTGEVHIQVTGRNLAIAPELYDQVVRKMQRLDKYLDRLQQIDVELWTEKTRDSDHQNHIEATTRVAGRTLRVAADDGEMHAAIDCAVDKLHRQLNRQKERMKSHHAGKLTDALPEPEIAASEKTENLHDRAEQSPAIHVERLEVKPQFEDEAIEEMDSQGRSFYVFLNARNEQLNVVYRRNDGSYGLIEPRTG